MEVIEKKDLLKLNDDPFVRSILATKGMPLPLNINRGDIPIMCDH